MNSVPQSIYRTTFPFVLALLTWWCCAHASSEAVAQDKQAERYPNVKLTTQSGKEVEFYNDLIKDKVAIINFMYTECKGVCNQSISTLEQVQKALGDSLGRDVFVYSITLDPEHDSPEVLNEYANAHGAKPGWIFLTGSSEGIAKVRESVGLADRTAASLDELGLPETESASEGGERKHSGMISIVYFGKKPHTKSSRLSPEEILEEIERLKPPTRARD